MAFGLMPLGHVCLTFRSLFLVSLFSVFFIICMCVTCFFWLGMWGGSSVTNSHNWPAIGGLMEDMRMGSISRDSDEHVSSFFHVFSTFVSFFVPMLFSMFFFYVFLVLVLGGVVAAAAVAVVFVVVFYCLGCVCVWYFMTVLLLLLRCFFSCFMPSFMLLVVWLLQFLRVQRFIVSLQV